MTPASPQDDRPTLTPPQFGTRWLFVAVAAAGILLTAIKYLGAYYAAILVLGAVSVLAHLAAASVGSRLRRIGDKVQDLKDDPLVGHSARGRRRKIVYAPTTKLHQRRPLGLPIFFATVLGGLTGATLAWALNELGIVKQTTKAELYFGMIAFALLGSMGTFLAASFCWVVFGAWRQASGETK